MRNMWIKARGTNTGKQAEIATQEVMKSTVNTKARNLRGFKKAQGCGGILLVKRGPISEDK